MMVLTSHLFECRTLTNKEKGGKTMYRGRDCNDCVNHACKIPSHTSRSQKQQEKRRVMNIGRGCVNFKSYIPMQTPLLYHLVMAGRSAPALELVRRAGMKVREKKNYPFFSLEVIH